MVLAVRKKLKSTHLNIPNSFYFNNFAQKSIPGVVRAQVLQEPVGASHGDQGRKFGMQQAYMCELQKTGVGSLRSANFKIVIGSANFCDRGGSGGGTEIFLTTKNLP